MTFCLSKGLCAPVGSVLCGDREFIRKAHRARKMLGGGMRQAGVLAAAGIVALERMVGRLGEDHERARGLARGLMRSPAIRLDAEMPATNMVFFSYSEAVGSTSKTLPGNSPDAAFWSTPGPPPIPLGHSLLDRRCRRRRGRGSLRRIAEVTGTPPGRRSGTGRRQATSRMEPGSISFRPRDLATYKRLSARWMRAEMSPLSSGKIA